MSHQPTVPYVTAAEFTAHPTYLALDAIRVGDSSAADQTDALNELLLKASAWARDQCDQPLHAHMLTEQRRLCADRYGRVKFTPVHGPVREITALSYGGSVNALTSVTNPTVWIDGTGHEPNNACVAELSGPQVGTWVGSLQFGGPVPGGPMYVSWTAVCGYTNTLVDTAGATHRLTSLPVMDATGIKAGDTLRICDPGKEEAVVVDAAWQMTTGPAVVPLATALVSDHLVNVGVSAIPGTVKLAVIGYTAAQLLVPEVGTEDPFADAAVSPTTSMNDPRSRGVGLVAEAARLLRSFSRVPHK
jgi:hypothetical protein